MISAVLPDLIRDPAWPHDTTGARKAELRLKAGATFERQTAPPRPTFQPKSSRTVCLRRPAHV